MEVVQSIQASMDLILQPLLMVLLIGAGIYLTVRLGFIQFRRLGHGIMVMCGKFDDPNDPGDVTHFQALTTALSATVGIGNIAGVAIALHFGGPGAIFWMWLTAVLGMATKYTEVTLAQRFRTQDTSGLVAGGPMYYIERGLGPNSKPLATFVAFFLMLTAILNGNAIQANTVADLLQTELNVPAWSTGLVTSLIVGLVILGGIHRIGKVTSYIAPGMAAIYVAGGLLVLVMNHQAVWPSLKLIFTEAFQPTAGIAGTGVGIFVQTMLWGIKRGLFSNEAGQGSAPIAHSAAKTKEPVSEGVVALLEPLIDTLIICTITALVIISSGVWKDRILTRIDLSSSDASLVVQQEANHAVIPVVDGKADEAIGDVYWHDVPVERLYLDPDLAQPFTGQIILDQAAALQEDGTSTEVLYGMAVETGAPLTQWAYAQSLGKLGTWIIILSVFLFAISTSISWCYYGDRCIHYLAGKRAIIPYKLIYVFMHFIGAISGLNFIWNLGDTTLSLVTIPNVIALILLSGVCARLTRDYFNRYG